jgi:Domain of unknown function (DUF5060)
MPTKLALLALCMLIVGCSAATPAAPTAAPAPTAPPAAPTAAPTEPPASFLRLSGAASATPAYELVELSIATDIAFANPFDPAEADLWVAFTSPSGAELRTPAFWYEGYDPATLQLLGEPGWRARLTPSEPGQWQAQAQLAAPALSSEPLSFTVEPNPAARGFIRRDASNPRYFAFDSGEPYLPIGPNIAWASSLETTIPQYQDWFGSLGANGGNVARVWMASWSFGIEWKDTGLGDYRARMRQAYLLDQVFNIAKEHDIYIMLCLLNHGAFSLSTNSEWADNPYNTASGGMLSKPADFATDPVAKELFKRRVRYIAARWGYSTNLFAWEWWNEVNWTPIGDDLLLPWVNELTPYLRDLDPYDHLVSSSYATGGDSPLWAEPAIDFAQLHDYSGSDPLRVTRDALREFRATTADKPVLLAEHGSSASGAEDTTGREQIHFHNGIWAPIFNGYAGSGMAWWWDSFIDPQERWVEYRYLSDFLAGERLAELEPARPSAGKDIQSAALRGPDRALVLIRSRAYDGQAAGLAYSEALRTNTTAGWVYEPPTLSGATLTLNGLSDGEYRAHWYDPQTGTWLAETAASVVGGELALPIPAFSRDLALKILPPDE